MIRLQWKSGANASLYQVWRNNADDSGTATLIADDHAGTVYEDTTATEGDDWYYWIKSKNSVGTSAFSPTIGPVAGPKTLRRPRGLLASLSSIHSITLTWDAVVGATSYDVYRATEEDFGAASLLDNVGTNEYEDLTATTEDERYFYWVVAKDGSGHESDESLAVIGYSAPPTPGAFTMEASDDQAGKVVVSWTASSNAHHYDIYRDAVLIDTVAGTETDYDDTGIDFHTVYSYEVKARNYTGEGSGGTDDGEAMFPVPSDVEIDATDGTHPSKVVLTWTPDPYATSYDIYRSTTPLEMVPTLLVSGVTDATYDDLVASGTTYYYRIKAVGESGTSPTFGNEDAGYAGGLPAPTDVEATDDDYDKVTVTWTAVDGADGYDVFRGFTQVGFNVAGTLFEDEPSAGDTWQYTVIAVNSVEESGASVGDFGTRPHIPAPTGLTATTDLTTGVDLNWSPVAEATHYDVYRDGSAIEVDLVDTEYEDTGAATCTSYTYHIVAKRVVSGLDTNSSAASSTAQGREVPSSEFCLLGGASASGGEPGYDQTFNFCGGNLDVYFNASDTIKDRLRLYLDGSPLWDSTCITGEATDNISVSVGNHTLRIEVIAHCDVGDVGTTAWSFIVACD